MERGGAVIGLLLLAVGLFTTGVFMQLKPDTVSHNLVIAGFILASGCLLGWICRMRVASGIAITTLLLIVRIIGPTAMAAPLLVLGASLIVGEKIQERAGSLGYVISALCGLAILTGLTGWLLPFHVHFFLTYLVVLGAISYFGRRKIFEAFFYARLRWRLAVSVAPG